MPGPSKTKSPHPNKGGDETMKEYIQTTSIIRHVSGSLNIHADWHTLRALSSAKKAKVVAEAVPGVFKRTYIIYYFCFLRLRHCIVALLNYKL